MNNMNKTSLGRSDLQVPRLGVGAMTWGDAKGFARLHPAKLAYGGAHGVEEEKRALAVSLEAEVNLFDTAAMYSGTASERRLGESAQGKDVLIATKFPASFFAFEQKDCHKNSRQVWRAWGGIRLTCTNITFLPIEYRFRS